MAKSKSTRRPSKPAQAPDFHGIRVSLFQAAGVVRAVRGALTSNVPTGEDQLQEALTLAAKVVDDAAAALEAL
jgi:hypothetical protein